MVEEATEVDMMMVLMLKRELNVLLKMERVRRIGFGVNERDDETTKEEKRYR